MIRVLQISDHLQMGGIQTFLMNVYHHMDRSQIQFDFLIFRQEEQHFEKEIESLGGKLYKLPGRKTGIARQRKALSKFFQEHPEYRIVHYHASSLSNVEPLITAKKAGIPKRVIHSHSSKASGKRIHTILHNLNKLRIADLATDYFACGQYAAEWMYGGTNVFDHVVIVNNGIDVEAYAFNPEIRQEVRVEMDLMDNYVVGHVGRFSDAKNHAFLIQVFKEILKVHPNAVLVLVGDGPLKKSIENQVKECVLEKQVVFLGLRDDVSRLLQAMDIFIMPSIYEGFPVSAVEAQSAGVPCIISDTVSKEVLLKSNCEFVSLQLSPAEWAHKALCNTERIVENQNIINAGFDIATTVIQLSEVYVL